MRPSGLEIASQSAMLPPLSRRAVGERRGDTISWAWIGTHNEFDKLFG
jgi:hypothetical protein